MCIIVAKDKGVNLPKKKTLRHCFDDNPDGAGLMFVRPDGKTVTVDKGYMTWKDFWTALRSYKFTKDDVVVLHFRRATAGTVDAGNCHPFPVVRSVKKLRETRIKTKMAMAHNGVCGRGEGKLSDTMVFVRDVLSDPTVKNNLDSPAIKALIHRYINVTDYGSRVVVLSADGKLRYFSKWIKDNGLRYSNPNFRPAPKPKKVKSYVPSKPKAEAKVIKAKKGAKKEAVLSRGTITCDTCFMMIVGYRRVGEPIWRKNSGEIAAHALTNGAWRCKRCVKWYERSQKEDK